MDIRQLDLNLLVVLDALLEARSVTRAAARLGLTQPAVSAALGRLRIVFGDPLLVRTPRGMTPTQRGLAVAAPVRHILSETETLVRSPHFDHRTAERSFRIAAADYAFHTVLVPLIEGLRKTAAGMKLAVLPVSLETERHLVDGSIDLALTLPDVAPTGAQSHALFDESYVCVLRRNHPALKSRLTLDRFCTLDHLLVSPRGGGFSGPTDVALAAIGHHRQVVLSVPSFLAVPPLLRVTDLVAVLPNRLVERMGPGLVKRAPPLTIPGFTLSAVWPQRVHADPAHRYLREKLIAAASPPKHHR